MIPLPWREAVRRLHYDYHFSRALTPRTQLPDIASVSAMTPGTWDHRSRLYPRADLVDAIDKRTAEMQRYGWLTEHLPAALAQLTEFSPMLYVVVQLRCIKGGAYMTAGGHLRHSTPWEDVRKELAQFKDAEDRRLLEWVDQGWEFLTLLLGREEDVKDAVARERAWKAAVTWCQDRGLL